MHWADVLADELHRRGSHHVFATAITPSGPIHVGNMREVLTTEAVYRAVKGLGDDAELIYIGDTYDPLRKVYPFLDKATYEPHVGKPLSDIPCPCGSHPSYAHHFLEPFLADLEQLGVRPKVLLAHEMYREGMYLDATKDAMDHAAEIREIMLRVAKREGKLPTNWIPFNVQCAGCARLNGPIPELYEYPYIEYRCTACGHEGKKDIRVPGEGKLPWRVDWPARWKFLEVTFEAMGKDHAAAGSSWDTGVEIVEKVYRYAPPVRTVYEFVQVKGVGAMHSSTGTAVSATDMLAMTPPEVLRFLFMRSQPNRHIDFDTGAWIVDLVNDYDRWEQAYFTGGEAARAEAQFKDLDRTYELSQPSGEIPKEAPPKVPYNHLVLLAQLKSSWDGVLESLVRTEIVPAKLTDEAVEHLKERVAHARWWLERFAPEDAKTEIKKDLAPAMVAGLDAAQRAFLGALAAKLADAKWTAEAIHNTVHETSKESGLPGAKGFAALYAAFLGRARGPRAGHLLASLERDFVVGRLKAAA
ncbi:MAG TPA: lysine--tRNA ligase [Candidatus Thermoplasmatota archaeon]|nr:lysine--tRNA ligase [Candidatus Thermoplasmatota archaeon]